MATLKIRGADGAFVEVPSLKGTDGISAYLHIRYGATATPAELLTTPNTYIGIAASASATAPTDHTGYTWYQWRGDDGQDGADGADGSNGLSAYEIAVLGGFVGTQAQWLASLVGQTGATGRGITTIERTSGTGAAGTTDTYTITYSDATTSTFSVYHGKDGKDFTILGYYADLTALQAAVTSPDAGDAYGIGSAAPYDIFVYDGVSLDWINNGAIQGAAGEDGATFTPSVSAGGDLSWTNDKELANPATVNIKGPAGTDGNDGQSAYEAAQAGGYTDTALNFYTDLAAVQGLAAEMASI